MAAVVAHEVRNPLAGIKGAVQVLMSRRASGDPELPVMGDIVARIDALGDLINDLMVFARPRPPRPAAIELRSLIREAVDMLRRDPVGASLDVDVNGPEVPLMADADLVRATLLNLLLNAAQAMNGHGRITVTVARHDDAGVIRVHDTGPGIPPELREQVFEPFFTTKARGGGLGLPIARRTAELHGGTLTLECPPDGGTTVSLALPLRSRTMPETVAGGRTSQSDSGPGLG
jgi:two-component system sensor histidine kinase PilS (NtrC family)